jgi:hypothetical protein
MASSAPEQHLRDVPASLVLAGSYIILGEHDATRQRDIHRPVAHAGSPATEGGTPAGFEQHGEERDASDQGALAGRGGAKSDPSSRPRR